ncbi:MAG: GntR family transcriptional regulator [Candidatus Acidiferrales bacterium]
MYKNRKTLLRIDLSSRVPAYEQIVSELRAVLVTGELEPGDALPTVRQLAADLGVHHNTVAQAYRILAEEEWLDLRRGRGARVVSRSPRARPTPKMHRAFVLQLKRLLANAAAEGISRKSIARELSFHARNLENWHLAEDGS